MADDDAQIRLSWVGYDEQPILFTNQILIQVPGPGEFVVAFGQVTGPPVVGTPEEQAQQLHEYEFVPIRPLVRLGLSPDRMREFVTALQASLDRYDAAIKKLDPRGGD
jgi:hypothetical protein